MTTQINFDEINRTNFIELYRTDQKEAEDRLEIMICDAHLVSQRIKWLLAQKLSSGVPIEQWDKDITRFHSTLNAIRQLGVIPALHAGRTTFAELLQIIEHPRAIFAAHEAMYDVDSSIPLDTLGSTNDESVEALESGDQSDNHSQATLPSLNRCFDDLSNLTSEQFVSRCHDAGILYAEASLIPQLSGASDEQMLRLASQEVIPIEDGAISIFAPLELIPVGLCRLTIMVIGGGGQVNETLSLFPPLSVIDGHWYWRKALLDLFGRDLDGMIVRAALETAAQTDFRTPEVREFVSKLPDGEQRQRAQRYLN